LREDQWERIKASLPGKAGDMDRTGDNGTFRGRDVDRSHRRALALVAPRVQAVVWCSPTVPTVGENEDLANDFQYPGGDTDTEC
jgi:hypothetical protein